MEAVKKGTVNGVNTDQLFTTIDLIKEKPDVAKFKFRATNKWVNYPLSRNRKGLLRSPQGG